MATGETPTRPRDALGPEDLQRFMYACSHERRSPITHRLTDASTYGWIHLFIRANDPETDLTDQREDWLEPHDADPAKLEAFFGRVAIRVRETGAYHYAVALQTHFAVVAESRQLPWPHR